MRVVRVFLPPEYEPSDGVVVPLPLDAVTVGKIRPCGSQDGHLLLIAILVGLGLRKLLGDRDADLEYAFRGGRGHVGLRGALGKRQRPGELAVVQLVIGCSLCPRSSWRPCSALIRRMSSVTASSTVLGRVDAGQLGPDHLSVPRAILVDADEVLTGPVPAEAEWAAAHRQGTHPLFEDPVHPIQAAGEVDALSRRAGALISGPISHFIG